MFRFAFITLFTAGNIFCQGFPSFHWIQQVDGSGSDAVIAIGTDAAGNTYIAGSTTSTDFPVKSAAQGHLDSVGLYRVDGSLSTPLGLTAVHSLAVDPQNPTTLYATTPNGAAMRSADGGNTWSAMNITTVPVLVIAVDPTNSQVLYAGANGQGAFKSTDGGTTWAQINNGNNQLDVSQIWIDPNHPSVLLVQAGSTGVRSADGGANWQTVLPSGFWSISFDQNNPGVIYEGGYGPPYASTDDGQTWTALGTTGLRQSLGVILLLQGPYSLLADPNQPGRLVMVGNGTYQSTDGGQTWTQGFDAYFTLVVPDWANGVLYGSEGSQAASISSDLQTVTPLGPSALPSINQIVVADPHVYVAVAASHDVFVTKLDPSGNIVYSTYFGGSDDDTATGMAVDATGNVYVAGKTSSPDFPITAGSFNASPQGNFLFKLNADGSVGFATFFSNAASVSGIAVDSAGEVYLAGTAGLGFPVTPGAYMQQIPASATCPPTGPFCPPPANYGFLTKFDATGEELVFSTFLPPVSAIPALALANDGTAYLSSTYPGVIAHVNATGSVLLGSISGPGGAALVGPMAVGSDGNLYATASMNAPVFSFPGTPGAFQAAPVPVPILPGIDQNDGSQAFVVKFDPQSGQILAETLLSGFYGDAINGIAFDASGNVVVGGQTAPQGFPTRTPLASSFSAASGFVSVLTPDLSNLLFSSYLGDTERFGVQGVAVSPNGDILIAGNTPIHVFVNSIIFATPPPLRIDSVFNAASLLSVPLSVGETIAVIGAGFGSDSQLSIGGISLPVLSASPASITATVPATIPTGVALIRVRSGGATSNVVEAPVMAAAPGLFSASGSGFGQGYILNVDGTLNSPANPAKMGDPISIFATGVGPLSLTVSSAVAEFPPTVYIGGISAAIGTATFGPFAGLTGNVFQLVARVPNSANIASPVSVVLQVNGVASQSGIALSVTR